MVLTPAQLAGLQTVAEFGDQGCPRMVGKRVAVNGHAARHLWVAGCIATKSGETRWLAWPAVVTPAGRAAIRENL